MPRPLRTAPGGFVYHVLNRANDKRRIFEHERDYLAFERVLAEVQERIPMRILAWCVMPNHWHPPALATQGWRSLKVHAPSHADAYPATPCLLRQRGDGPSLPRALQIVRGAK